MKLVRFGVKRSERPGIIDANNNIRDLSSIVADWDGDSISDAALRKVLDLTLSDFPIVPEGIRLAAPIAGTRKVVCCALTYAEHALEAGLDTPTEPMFMLISATAINGPADEIVIPRGGSKLDFEAELGVVIGKAGSYIPVEEAASHVAGYCVANDISERTFQLERGTQWTKGKSANTFKPLGPWLVTKDEVEDPNSLDISMTVNGEIRQSSNTSDMVFSVPQLVARVSDYLEWEPGDVLLTGTPPGVAYGMDNPVYLKEGDIVSSAIECLGRQKNTIRQYTDQIPT